MNPENPMQRTPLQTLLEERLRSARGLGWDMRDFPPLEKPLFGDKGGRRDLPAGASGDAFSNPPKPPFMNGGIAAGKAPAWFRFAYLGLRSLGLVRG